jgi:hypothetical protein
MLTCKIVRFYELTRDFNNLDIEWSVRSMKIVPYPIWVGRKKYTGKATNSH